jgi:beta-glucosidase
VGSDYPATHSTSGILQGEDQEMPTQTGFFSADSGNPATDPTGSTCGDATGQTQVPCSATGAVHAGGIPGTGCPVNGCKLVDAVMNGSLPLAVFNQSLARILYQEQRFGILGCDNSPVAATCTNPGGVGSDRTGTANLPGGPTSGAPVLGTFNGDAAIVERMSEEGATLLKDSGSALPLDASSLNNGDVLITGANANHTVADPTSEASTGTIDRDAVNPLQQLKQYSGKPGAFTYVPANDPTGSPVPPSVLATSADQSALGGLSLSVDGGAATKDTSAIDRSATNGNQLAAGHTYTWSGDIYVPSADTYSFAIQQSPTLPTTLNCPQTGQNGTPATNPPALTMCSAFTATNASQLNQVPDAVTFTLDGAKLNLNATTAVIYGATVPTNPTTAGYTDQGLISRTCATGTAALEPGTANCGAAQSALTPGFHSVQITVNNATNCVSTPAAASNPAIAPVPAPCAPASFRFAYTRAQGDITDAAAAAAGKKAAIVFVNDGVGASSTTPNPDLAGTTISGPTQLSAASTNLVNAVSAANPNTIVVMDTGNPVLMPWFDNVKSVLQMWFAGQEGGTATARVLLGLANPGGHSSLTWPKNGTDTIWGYNEPAGALYPGSTGGRHPERLNGNGGCAGTGCPAGGNTVESEGIYAGYRYFDKLGITPQIPFGYGLSYTTFGFSNLNIVPKLDGTVDVNFDVTNTGSRAGDEAAQVYVGPGPDRPGIQQAVRSLRGFDRVSLAAGETKHETINLDRRSFQYWDETTQQWLSDYGARTISVGDADATANLPLSGTITPLTSAAQGTVSGTVPATLSLTLGAPATFGAFTPGVDATYTAGTTANVISTAGDGALSVSDPDTAHPGHLVNGSFVMPQALQAKATSPAGAGSAFAPISGSPATLLTYSGPVSNDPVAITFQQAIARTDALRTGNYSKTLTFTLSTTNP